MTTAPAGYKYKLVHSSGSKGAGSSWWSSFMCLIIPQCLETEIRLWYSHCSVWAMTTWHSAVCLHSKTAAGCLLQVPHKVAIKMSAGLYVNINQFLTNGEQIGRRTYKTGGIRNKGIFHCEPFSNKDLGLYSLNFLVLTVAPSDEISLNWFCPTLLLIGWLCWLIFLYDWLKLSKHTIALEMWLFSIL